MFAKKLIVVAAAIALAVANVAAVEEASHLKIHITKHHVKDANITDTTLDVTYSNDGSEADSGSGSGGEYTDYTEGSGSNEEGEGSESSGSSDGPVNYGSEDTVCEGDDASPMSVEGVEGVFCVSGQACAGVEGACPGPQDGLEFGSYCGTVKSGVLGCKPYTAEPTCADDEKPISVEGVEGIFCVTGQLCAGVDGACPGPQDGLEFGSRCDTVSTGVLGCVPNDAKHHKKSHHHFGKTPAHFKHTQFKPAHVKAANIKADHKKAAHHAKKVTAKKPVVHKVAAKKPAHKDAHKKVEHKKVEHKKVEHKKVEHKDAHKKVEHKKPAHKDAHKKVEHKKVQVHKVEAKKPAHKDAHKKVEHKKPAHKDAHKKVEHKKVEHKKPAHKDAHKKAEHKDAHKDAHKKPAHKDAHKKPAHKDAHKH